MTAAAPTTVVARPRPANLALELRSADQRRVGRVDAVSHFTLLVSFAEGERPPAELAFDGARVGEVGTAVELGRCSFVPHPHHPLRRADDPPPDPGDGRLVFLDAVYDFSSLIRDGAVGNVEQKLRQLPLVWKRKEGVKPAFRDYAADLLYDLQAYRLLLDEIDRDLEPEPRAVRGRIRANAIAIVYPDFARFFDGTLDRLAEVVRGLSRQEHERHGFYFRRHVWDLILSSPFLARTNLKPRGYAGDSVMMEMVYEQGFRGGSLFSMCLHHHPIMTPAAQAVRNRRALIAGSLHRLLAEAPRDRRLRVMSVACGPAAEVAEMIRTPDDANRLELVFLDQDSEALAEGAATVARAAKLHGAELPVRLIRESVRTMLRTPDLAEAWGQFDFVYTMGLFDYLQHPVARVVMRKLYDLLRPGGELLIGNFHAENPTRVYMEYWMDWVLVYRVEEEMRELAAGIAGATAEISFEATRSQLFLHLRKPR